MVRSHCLIRCAGLNCYVWPLSMPSSLFQPALLAHLLLSAQLCISYDASDSGISAVFKYCCPMVAEAMCICHLLQVISHFQFCSCEENNVVDSFLRTPFCSVTLGLDNIALDHEQVHCVDMQVFFLAFSLHEVISPTPHAGSVICLTGTLICLFLAPLDRQSLMYFMA